ncbi:hypothetical protein NL676_023085 [Syzygium grande]|nr:hypothetical protein NL676_023085 [Syzygium grande]
MAAQNGGRRAQIFAFREKFGQKAWASRSLPFGSFVAASSKLGHGGHSSLKLGRSGSLPSKSFVAVSSKLGHVEKL